MSECIPDTNNIKVALLAAALEIAQTTTTPYEVSDNHDVVLKRTIDAYEQLAAVVNPPAKVSVT